MLTLGGKLRDFVERAATDRRKSRERWCFRSVATDEVLALGADEAGLLGGLLTVEPDLGDSAAVAR